jgi:hypothetical protein
MESGDPNAERAAKETAHNRATHREMMELARRFKGRRVQVAVNFSERFDDPDTGEISKKRRRLVRTVLIKGPNTLYDSGGVLHASLKMAFNAQYDEKGEAVHEYPAEINITSITITPLD